MPPASSRVNTHSPGIVLVIVINLAKTYEKLKEKHIGSGDNEILRYKQTDIQTENILLLYYKDC